MNPVARQDPPRPPDQTFRIGPRPDWISGSAVRWDAPAGKDDHLTTLLHECRHAPREGIIWVRRVTRLETREAVQPGSQVMLDWDPETEDLVVQTVRIWRNGAARDFTDPERFLLRQRESELVRGLVTGQMSALVLLEDVRPGDAVELEFHTVQTRQFPGARFDDNFRLQHPTATVDWLHAVHLPPGGGLEWKGFGGEAEPVVATSDRGTVWTWRAESLPRMEAEPALPDWVYPWPWVQVSEFPDWKAVADCISQSWAASAADTSAIREKAAEIAAGQGDAELRILEAIRFVQDDVRYLGLSMGHGRLIPSAPDKVLRRLYGDCKDKSVLLCALLAELGVKAEPVLVHSAMGRILPERLPAMACFDHVIVRIHADGRHAWVDPAIAGQGGRLFDRHLPDYRCGLVVAAGTSALVELPEARPDAGTVHFTENFYLSQSGGRSRVDWQLDASGADADGLRAWVRLNGAEKFGEIQLEELRRGFPHLRRLAAPGVADDLLANTFRISASFAMHDWGDRMKGTTNPFAGSPRWVLGRITKPPQEGGRRLPRALAFPVSIRHEIFVHMKRPPHVNAAKRRVHNEWFEYDARLEREGGCICFAAGYRALRDHLEPADIPAFARHIARLEDFTGFTIPVPWFGPSTTADPGEEAVKRGNPLKPATAENSHTGGASGSGHWTDSEDANTPEWDRPSAEQIRHRRRLDAPTGYNVRPPGGVDARAVWLVFLVVVVILRIVFAAMAR